MKAPRYAQYFIAIIVTSIACLFAMNSVAKTINLYAEPKQDSKILESINSENGVITIFQPKNSEWIKVANPQNGNVGWMKMNDLGNTQFNVQIIQSDQGPKHYHVIQYGNMPPAGDDQHIAATIEQMQKRQQMIQREMQQNMQNMFKLMQEEWANFPIIVPVVTQPTPTTHAIKPAQNASKPTTTQKPITPSSTMTQTIKPQPSTPTQKTPSN